MEKKETEGILTWNALAYILKAKSSSEINIDFSYGYGTNKTHSNYRR